MVVKKGGTPLSAKKKTIEELKKLNEKKKIMMEEESDEEDTSEEEEEESDSETGDDEANDDEGSDEDDDDDDEDEDEEEDDDDDDDDDDEDDDEEDVIIDSPKKQKGQTQTPAKSAKSPNKQSFLSSPRKNEVQSNKKTPNKGKKLAQNESPMIVSPKKSGKTGDDPSRTPSPSKQQKNKSIVKGTAEKRKREGGDEERTSKKPRDDLPADRILTDEQKRQRDRRCLFIKQIPPGTTEHDIKILSSDIVSVRIPLVCKRKRRAIWFGFVEFINEEKAEENLPVLQNATFKGEKLFVDYVGEKSKRFSTFQKPAAPPRSEDKKKLFLTGLPQNTTMEDIGKHFPNAISISMRPSGNNRFGSVEFETESAGEEACKQNSSLKIKGQNVTVMFAYSSKPKPKSNRRSPKKRPSKPADQKSMFTTNQKKDDKKKEESDDDDDDDKSEEEDDESEEDDDDDDSDEE